MYNSARLLHLLQAALIEMSLRLLRLSDAGLASKHVQAWCPPLGPCMNARCVPHGTHALIQRTCIPLVVPGACLCADIDCNAHATHDSVHWTQASQIDGTISEGLIINKPMVRCYQMRWAPPGMRLYAA